MSGREFYGLVMLAPAALFLWFAYQSIRRAEPKYAILYGAIVGITLLLSLRNLL